MNTTGLIRGYMAKNMKNEEFVNHVVEQMGKEFAKDITLIITDNYFDINMDGYDVSIDKAKAEELQQKGAYALDKFLLDELRKQEFIFSNERSQYIRYCYGLFNYKVDGSN